MIKKPTNSELEAVLKSLNDAPVPTLDRMLWISRKNVKKIRKL